MKLDITGFEQLMNEFNQMATSEIAKYEKDAVKAGAEIVRQKQETLWNKSTDNEEHIKQNITIGRAFDMAEGTGIAVAPKMSLRWRAKFVEYGTSYQAPQAPVERSGQETEQQATQAMMRELEKVIR